MLKCHHLKVGCGNSRGGRKKEGNTGARGEQENHHCHVLSHLIIAYHIFLKEGPGYRVNKAMMLRMKKKEEEEEAERLLIGR